MLEAVPLLAVTVGFLSVFLYTFSKLQLDDIRTNWNTRRCEPLVLTIAHLVPDGSDPSVEPGQFSVDNFQFCIGKLIDSSVSMFMGPMLKVFSSQVDATKPINDSMMYLREMAQSLLKPINGLFQTLFLKFGFIAFQVLRVFLKLTNAFDRIFGIATASIFAGMGMYKAIQNMMNFVINVCIIILTVLAVLVVFLWFVMWPVIPVILTLIGVLSATVHGGRVSGMAGSFCVAPETLVRTKNGWEEAQTLKPGDSLWDGSLVEGVLETVGAPVVRYKGVLISPSHLVWHNGTWSPAGVLDEAESCDVYPERLVCLNTSSHMWEVRGQNGEILTLRDWEELPDGFDRVWEYSIAQLLGTKLPESSPGRGLLGPETHVYVEGRGLLPISKVRLGEFVKDVENRFTKVLAVYSDCSELVPSAGPNTAAWVRLDGTTWGHRVFGTPSSTSGYHLITESGTFLIQGGWVVRDFTEVGIHRIHETSPLVEFLLEAVNRNDASHNLSCKCASFTYFGKCLDDKLCVPGFYGAR